MYVFLLTYFCRHPGGLHINTYTTSQPRGVKMLFTLVQTTFPFAEGSKKYRMKLAPSIKLLTLMLNAPPERRCLCHVSKILHGNFWKVPRGSGCRGDVNSESLNIERM